MDTSLNRISAGDFLVVFRRASNPHTGTAQPIPSTLHLRKLTSAVASVPRWDKSSWRIIIQKVVENDMRKEKKQRSRCGNDDSMEHLYEAPRKKL